MNARTAILIGVWAMIVTASSMAQTPPGGTNPVPKAQTDLDLIAVTILKDVHNRGAELYNRGDAVGCYRMYEGALVTVKAFLTHRPAVQKAIDDALTEVGKTDGAKIQAFRLHEVIEQVRGELKTDTKAVEGGTPMPSTKEATPKSAPVPVPKKEESPKPNELAPMPKAKTEFKKPGLVEGTVAGTVTIQGKPLSGSEITIVSLGLPSPRVFTARVVDGKYKFDAAMPGGQYVVMFTGPPPTKIMEKYQTTQTSNLTIDIKAGANNFDLNLQ